MFDRVLNTPLLFNRSYVFDIATTLKMFKISRKLVKVKFIFNKVASIFKNISVGQLLKLFMELLPLPVTEILY